MTSGKLSAVSLRFSTENKFIQSLAEAHDELTPYLHCGSTQFPRRTDNKGGDFFLGWRVVGDSERDQFCPAVAVQPSPLSNQRNRFEAINRFLFGVLNLLDLDSVLGKKLLRLLTTLSSGPHVGPVDFHRLLQ